MPHTNPHENTSEGGPEYEELSNVIDVSDAEWDVEGYRSYELDVLQPRLVALGYTEIRWTDGERDAFGPLSRVATCRNAAGEVKAFIYG